MIEINNLTVKRIDKNFLKSIAQRVLKEEKHKKINLSIALVGKKKIKTINKRFRGKDEVTDVLSFGEGVNEIIICPAVVKTKKELALILIHGILHLLGYEHGPEMEKKQKDYLSKFF